MVTPDPLTEKLSAMMGTQNKQTPLFLYQVNLEARIHPDHPLRKIKAAIDFSSVRAEVEDRYGGR